MAQSEKEFYRNILDNMTDGVYFVDKDRQITYWNQGAEGISGFAPSEVRGQWCGDDVLHHVDDNGEKLCDGSCPLLETMDDGQPREIDAFMLHKAGHRVPVHIKASPIYDDDGKIIGAVEVFSDSSPKISAVQRAQELEREAYVDVLTDLPNRRYVEGALRSRLSEFQRYGWPFGLLMIDIDDFKLVNDMYGHDVGDKLLVNVSETMKNCFRPFDVVGRWGGEEFIAIVANVSEDLSFISAAERLRSMVEESELRVDDSVLRSTISIGGTIVDVGDSADMIIKRADELLYACKTAGKNRVKCV